MADILANIWGKIYAWAMPCALAYGAFWLLVYPSSDLTLPWFEEASVDAQAVIFIALTGTTAFCLNIFSTALYRVLEGYWFWPKWLQDWSSDRQRRRKKKLQDAVAGIGAGWAYGLAIENLQLYPQNDAQVVPTRFGNALRSFEQYGKSRFNLDSQTMWDELVAVSPKFIQTELDSARASVDFFVASIYVSAVFGLLTVYFAYRQGWPLDLDFIAVVAFLLAVCCRELVLHATRDWSLAVQAMVNLGRAPLADRLGLALPATLAEERKMWGHVTKYVYFVTAAEGTALDAYRKKPKPDTGGGDDEEDDGE